MTTKPLRAVSAKKKVRARPTCQVCRHPADREQDVKGKFYVACYWCGYDSRYGISPQMAALGVRPTGGTGA